MRLMSNVHQEVCRGVRQPKRFDFARLAGTSTMLKCLFLGLLVFLALPTIIMATMATAQMVADRSTLSRLTNRWVPVNPTGVIPKERVGWQKLVYDDVNDKIWLFAAAGGATYRAYANDVWLFDIGTNTWAMVRDISAEREPPDAPSWRHSEQGRTFDTKSQKIVLFGQQSSSGAKNDTWIYDVPTDKWQEMKPSGDIPPIPNHFEYALEYDRAANVSVLFGGERQWSYPSDVWEFDLDSNRWTRYPFSPPSAPEGRRGHGMTYCDALGGILVFGGGSGWTGVLDFNDVWLYRAVDHSWQELASENPPPPRRQFSFDYDPINNVCLVFSGGVGEGTVSDLYSDTWIYHVAEGRWEQLESASGPPPDGRGDMMVYARRHGAFFLMSADGNVWKFQFGDVATGVEDTKSTECGHDLAPNYPNPFNLSTEISYRVALRGTQRDSYVTLRIFNVLGQEIVRLVDGFRQPGEYKVKWTGRNSIGQEMPTGVYVYELRIGDFHTARKMVLIK